MSERIGHASIVRDADGVTFVGTGPLDYYNDDDFREPLIRAAESEENVTVDLRNVGYIDTHVVADLAKAAQKMRSRGLRLKALLQEDTHPFRVFQMIGLPIIIDVTIYPREG